MTGRHLAIRRLLAPQIGKNRAAPFTGFLSS